MHIILDSRLLPLSKHLKNLPISFKDDIFPLPSILIQDLSSYSSLLYFLLSSPSDSTYLPSSLDSISTMECYKTSIILFNIPVSDSLSDLLSYNLSILSISSLKELSFFLLSLISHSPCANIASIQRVSSSEDPWVNFLTSIPGITLSKAQAISQHFYSISHLLSEYSKSTDPAFMLSTIPVGSLKLGRALSGKIYKFITSREGNELI
jgi:hypothetical protein